MRGPKIVVIGAGSFFFGRPVVWNMVKSDVLRGGTLALVDTRPEVVDTMMRLARRAVEATGAPTKLLGTTDRREALRDADFVVLTFSERNAHFRGLDCEVSLTHGVRMCSGDTIGPGGIFRALREIPRALAMARDAAELAPGAWTINFVNPTTVLGIALMRYAPQVRSFAICDGLHEPHYRLGVLKRLGVVPQEAKAIPADVAARLIFHVMGVNHFTWVTRLEYDGRDLRPAWRDLLARDAADEVERIGTATDGNATSKARYNAAYALQLMDLFGAYPDRIAHTKEYVPYFQGLGVAPNEPAPIAIFDAEERRRAMDARWRETEDFAHGRAPIGDFLKTGRGDHATDIVESMWGGLGKAFYINTSNRGAVTNMAADAYLEALCDLDMQGPRPRLMGPMPRGLLGLQQQVLDTHELTAEAAVTFDRRILLRAMMTDPIVNNLGDGRRIMEELLERERDILPAEWRATTG